MKILFHGSDHIIRQPLFRGGKPYCDYGYGFYCTEHADMAKEWAVNEDHDGFANRYQLDTRGLKILYLSRDYTILSWLAVLLAHRTFTLDSPLAREARRYILETFSVQIDDCDAIYGYRADDSYFSFAQDFLNGTISYEKLTEAMYLGHLGMQFVLKSEECFRRIRYLDAERALRSEYLEQKRLRDLKARQAYLYSDRSGYRKGELYISRILDEEVKPDDPRLR